MAALTNGHMRRGRRGREAGKNPMIPWDGHRVRLRMVVRAGIEQREQTGSAKKGYNDPREGSEDGKSSHRCNQADDNSGSLEGGREATVGFPLIVSHLGIDGVE